MAQQENTLGAPTEGLGQNVTFAFDPRSGLPQLNIPSAGPTRMGVETGRSAGVQLASPRIDPVQSATVDLLMKAGSAVLSKKLEAAKITKYVEGMQRAMAGEAVQDIADEQPWFTQLFGDAAVVEGARAYSQHANVVNAVGKLEEAMPKLREMPAAEAARFLSESVQSSLTGDKATDMAIMQSYSKVLPGFARRQAKEHYAWKQEQAVTAQTAALSAQASHFDRASKGLLNGMTNDAEYMAMKDELLQLSRPPIGQPVEGWQNMMHGTIIGMAARGELHSLRAFKEAGISGSLPPQQALEVETAIKRAETRALPQMTERFSVEMAALMTMATHPQAGANTEQLAARIDALNERARKQFGTSYGPISPDEKVALLKGSMSAIVSAQEAAQNKRIKDADAVAGKAGKDEAITATILADLEGGRSLSRLKLNPDITDDKLNATLVNVYTRAKDPAARAQVLHRAATLGHDVVPTIRDELEGAVTAAITDKGVDWSTMKPVYDAWKAMHQLRPELAARYFGKYAGQLAMFDRGMQTHGSLPAAARAAFEQKPPKGKLDKAEVKAAAGAVSDAYNRGLPSWAIGLRRTPLKDGQEAVLTGMIGEDMELNAGIYGSSETGARVSVDAALRAGKVEMLGGYVISSDPSIKPLAQYLTDPSGYTGNKGDKRIPFGQGSDMLDDMLEEAIDLKLHGPKGLIPPTGLIARKADVVRVYRVGDKDGVPQLVITAAAGADTFHGDITGDELFALRDKVKAERDARGANRKGGTARELRNVFVPPGQ